MAHRDPRYATGRQTEAALLDGARDVGHGARTCSTPENAAASYGAGYLAALQDARA